ncbi:sensor histidine kinase [Kribbella sp. NPDC004875]|uniref:sensor histidine kinase n=1 Tax=Kribbella sp. NPDC004875 TaxID=3364107 RepID=UPI00369194FB
MSRHSWPVVAVTLAWLVPAVTYTLSATDATAGQPVHVLALAAIIGLAQLRLSVAVSKGGLPPGWPAVFAVLLVAVYAPLPWWSWNWISMQCFAAASSAMVLRRHRRTQLVVAALLLMAPVAADTINNRGSSVVALQTIYDLVGLSVAAGSLYAAPQLVRFSAELRTSRLALAESAVEDERLRLSRDLHDLLGQSLSAVSLKGDLALALLDQDPVRARREIAEAAEVSRHALRDLQAVTRDDHEVSLAAELAGATRLLAAANVQVSVDTAVLPSTVAGQEVFGWAIREGVTNLLRHSRSRSCTMTTSATGRTVRLEIVNDGAPDVPGSAGGSGLAGLAERVADLSGSVRTSRRGDQFRLTVEIAEDTP